MQAGKSVVITIHQPSSRMFNMFDKLILLGKGRSLYFGKASEAMLYFSSIGCSPLIPMNPAEFLIDLANGNINDKSIPMELELKSLNGSQEITCHEGSPSPIDIHEVCRKAKHVLTFKLFYSRAIKYFFHLCFGSICWEHMKPELLV